MASSFVLDSSFLAMGKKWTLFLSKHHVNFPTQLLVQKRRKKHSNEYLNSQHMAMIVSISNMYVPTSDNEHIPNTKICRTVLLGVLTFICSQSLSRRGLGRCRNLVKNMLTQFFQGQTLRNIVGKSRPFRENPVDRKGTGQAEGV